MGAAETLDSSVVLPIDEIRFDGGTQSRAQLNEETISDYAEKYSAGVAFPPVVVFYDGLDHWLADGFHRCAGAKRAGKTSVVATVRQGTARDAILFSVGANDSHGLRRTNADKRRAVEMLLRDEEWSNKSPEWIAEQCGVSRPFVIKLRDEQGVTVTPSTTFEGKDGKQYPATLRRMPERQPEAKPEPQPEPVEPSGVEHRSTPEPDPKQWWCCPVIGCGREYSLAGALKLGWNKRGYCDDCGGVAEEAFEPIHDEPEAQPEMVQEPDVVMDATLDRLTELATQRNADREFAQLRATQRAVAQAMPSKAQRMLDFILDGGELALVRLGLDWSVNTDSLRAAFRERSRVAHPDRGGTQDAFIRLTSDQKLIKTMLGDT